VSKLFRLALDSLLRQRERTAFTIVGLALAIATVVLVFSISLRFEGSSTDSLGYVTQGGNLWVLPPGGFESTSRSGFVLSTGRLSDGAVAALARDGGISSAAPAIVGETPIGETTLVVYGRGDGSGTAVLGTAAASALGASAGSDTDMGGHVLRVTAVDEKVPPTAIVVSLDDAAAITGDPRPSWIVATATDVRKLADASTDLTVTSDPSVQSAGPGALALAYALNGQLSRFDVFSFKAKFGQTVMNKSTSTIFGQIARITLLLGFLLAISSALMTIEERRVEFGILAAVGITDDVLYLFLAESALVFVAGFVLGVLLGGATYLLLLPALFDPQALLKATLITATYIPAMLILGALIPLNRLLQRSPLELLRSAA
jgi:putative ABC transport system permease protein